MMRLMLLWVACAAMVGCQAPPPANPLKVLADTNALPDSQVAAMRVLDAAPKDPEYCRALRRMVVLPGYPAAVRREAFERAYEQDREELARTLEDSLTRMEALEWRRELCERIAEKGWKEMTPTLVRAWARPMPGWIREWDERPEAKALAALWGKDRVPDEVFNLFVTADPIFKSGLRLRCWELLIVTGHADRLRELLAEAPRPDEKPDAMISDLRRVSRELGILPTTGEEILWARRFCSPQQQGFMAAAAEAVGRMPAEVRATLQMKDIPVAVAALHHAPSLLDSSRADLYAALESQLSGRDAQTHTANFEGYGSDHSERLAGWEKKLTWGDLAAMLLARGALGSEPVRRHIFEIADRDRADISTEYGGILRLDPEGRYEVVEFPPRIRGSDFRFEASPDLFDAGYTALFHWHLHAQAWENDRYAGPHLGDFSYADSTGVNGLVFTFIDFRHLNVDWYRRGQVVVDLGVIKRPDSP